MDEIQIDEPVIDAGPAPTIEVPEDAPIETVTVTASRLPNWPLILGALGAGALLLYVLSQDD